MKIHFPACPLQASVETKYRQNKKNIKLNPGFKNLLKDQNRAKRSQISCFLFFNKKKSDLRAKVQTFILKSDGASCLRLQSVQTLRDKQAVGPRIKTFITDCHSSFYLHL